MDEREEHKPNILLHRNLLFRREELNDKVEEALRQLEEVLRWTSTMTVISTTTIVDMLRSMRGCGHHGWPE
jgi:hypothetical protein